MPPEDQTQPDQEAVESKNAAFTRYWIQSQHAITGFVSMHVNDYAMVEDIVQEVASQASKNFDQYDPSRPFSAWLIGIARLRIVDMLRARGRRPLTLSGDVLESLTNELAVMQTQSSERLDALQGCMGKLNERHRRIVELRYARQQSSDKIASAVGSNAIAVDSMLYRIRDALRQCIAKQLEGDH
ncbi:MAG: sigma-70 family RNA polymerase sigma factor [Phycisphaeraceae bacterium]|nr:sigma-70 family RNA polymerase sigma factor [Phycisphaeraceae bacterium]